MLLGALYQSTDAFGAENSMNFSPMNHHQDLLQVRMKSPIGRPQ